MDGNVKGRMAGFLALVLSAVLLLDGFCVTAMADTTGKVYVVNGSSEKNKDKIPGETSGWYAYNDGKYTDLKFDTPIGEQANLQIDGKIIKSWQLWINNCGYFSGDTYIAKGDKNGTISKENHDVANSGSGTAYLYILYDDHIHSYTWLHQNTTDNYLVRYCNLCDIYEIFVSGDVSTKEYPIKVCNAINQPKADTDITVLEGDKFETLQFFRLPKKDFDLSKTIDENYADVYLKEEYSNQHLAKWELWSTEGSVYKKIIASGTSGTGKISLANYINAIGHTESVPNYNGHTFPVLYREYEDHDYDSSTGRCKCGKYNPAQYVSVEFYDGASRLSVQTVEKGTEISKPDDLSKEGFIFKGWFADEACKKAFDFDTAISEDETAETIRIYAGWEMVTAPTTVTDDNTDKAPAATPAVEPAKPGTKLTIGGSKAAGKSTFKVTGGGKEPTVVFTKADKKATTVTIPSVIKDENNVSYKVTEISASAFSKCTSLKKVTIGENIEKIGKNAFSGCKSLKTVSIKSTALKSIGKNAFKGIHKKAKISVPKKQKKAYTSLLKKAKYTGKIK